VRLEVTVSHAYDIAKSMTSRDGLAFLDNPDNMKYSDIKGIPQDIPEKIQKDMVSTFKNELMARDDKTDKYYADTQVGLDPYDIGAIDATIKSLLGADIWDAALQEKWFDRLNSMKLRALSTLQDSGRLREKAAMDVAEGRAEGYLSLLLASGRYPEAKNFVLDLHGDGKVSQDFLRYWFPKTQREDDPYFNAAMSELSEATKGLPVEEQAAISGRYIKWYDSLRERPTPEQLKKAVYDAKTPENTAVPDNWNKLLKAVDAIGKGAYEISTPDSKAFLDATAGDALSMLRRWFPKDQYGVDFNDSSVFAFPDERNDYGLGRGYPVVRVKKTGEIYTLVKTGKGNGMELRLFNKPKAGPGTWDLVAGKPAAPPQQAPTSPAQSKAGDITGADVAIKAAGGSLAAMQLESKKRGVPLGELALGLKPITSLGPVQQAKLKGEVDAFAQNKASLSAQDIKRIATFAGVTEADVAIYAASQKVKIPNE
jgi:hypothetical protein